MASAAGVHGSTASAQMEMDELVQYRIKNMSLNSGLRIAHIRAQAEAHRNELEKLLKISEKIEEADVQVCKIYLERYIQNLYTEIYGKTPAHQPMRNIPPEILGWIFQYHVESGHSPWILVKVCKFWMQTALETPRLWRHLLLVGHQGHNDFDPYVFDGKTYYSSGNKQVCLNLTQVDAALRRAGVVPLTIKLDQRTWTGDRMVEFDLPRILGDPMCLRIEHLDVSNAFLSEEALPDDMSIGPFPCLRSLKLDSLDGIWVEKLLGSISSASKNFDTLQFGWSMLIPSGFAENSFWGGLKGLHLPLTTEAPLGDLFNEVVPQLGLLEHLSHPPEGWPNDRTPISQLPNIRRITLTCNSRHLHRLGLPQLKELYLTETAAPTSDSSSTHPQLSFPRLITFSLKTNEALWPQYLTGAFPKVTNFTLDCGMSEGAIISILEAIPTVKNVTLRGPSRQDFGVGLLEALQRTRGSLPCPNLRTMELGGKDDPVLTLKKTARPLLKELIWYPTWRRKPIQKVTIHWKRGTEVIRRGQRLK